MHCVGGEVLVIHDDTLDRTTNGSGPLATHDLTYLRSLDAGKGEQIPLLNEVLDLLAGRAGLNIELKGAGTAEPVAAVLGNYLQRGVWQPEQLLVSSFDKAELQRFEDQAPDIPIGLLVAIPQANSVQVAVDMGAASLNLPLGG